VNPTCFVDANALVYARDASAPAKQPAAESWLRLLWATRSVRVCSQALNEYYFVVTEQPRPGSSGRDEARADVRNLMAWAPVSTDGPVVEGAWTVQDRYGLSWWDSLVAPAAQVAGCAWLLTAGLQQGQALDGVTVVDPFRTEPEELLG